MIGCGCQIVRRTETQHQRMIARDEYPGVVVLTPSFGGDSGDIRTIAGAFGGMRHILVQDMCLRVSIPQGCQQLPFILT